MMAVASDRLAGLAGSCARTDTVESIARNASMFEISLARALIAELLQARGGRNVQTSSRILTMVAVGFVRRGAMGSLEMQSRCEGLCLAQLRLPLDWRLKQAHSGLGVIRAPE